MLSILIPAYNYDVRSLVYSLNKQCQEAKITYEIRVLDDASETEFKEINREIHKISSVIYEELTENYGRAKIRNTLAARANYNYLLFLDCDAAIPDLFIKNYLKAGLDKEMVVCGGRIYSDRPPKDNRYYLHWKYGTKKESMNVEQRKRKMYQSFMTNNFVIAKSIFKKIKFEESIRSYGHEDTLFGMELKEAKIPIIHIHNPVSHLGLETNEAFIAKTEEAIKNLTQIEHNQAIQDSVSLIKSYQFIEKMGGERFYFVLFKKIRKMLLNNLRSPHPSLTLFALYKLGYLISLKINNDF